ncbi:Vesicle-mediated ER to Golgi transport protein [Saitoella coloradoensis]
MDILAKGLSVLSAQPQQQSADETIAKLCDRLEYSTLLEDRRAAVLGLKGFSRDFKEQVATGGLAGLILTLTRDAGDLDTLKAALETLLVLFYRDSNDPRSTDPSKDFQTWMADAFISAPQNISSIIEILDQNDFYVRLFALQLLANLMGVRGNNMKELMFADPTALSRLVATLGDGREAVRNEGLLLLIALSDANTDIQKLIAFENAFERLFEVVEIEGGLDGGIVTQDCLQLLNNLLHHNTSNQTLFRELGSVPRLAKLLSDGKAETRWNEQKATNLSASIALGRAFVERGAPGVEANQKVMASSGILDSLVEIGFSDALPIGVRAHALTTCADMIRSNPQNQGLFARSRVVGAPPPPAPGASRAPTPGMGKTISPVMELLLIALYSESAEFFELRAAAVLCFQGYIQDNDIAKGHIVEYLIDIYFRSQKNQNTDGEPGLLDCILWLEQSSARKDPYKVWFACVLLMHLLFENPRTKSLLHAVTIGEAADDEDVVTAVQTLAANLVTSIRHSLDPRIPLAYAMLLCAWLWEDTPSVIDFLHENGNVSSLVGTVAGSGGGYSEVMVQGLCACLLGMCYEFDEGDSPIPREKLHSMLVDRIGKDQFVNRIARLRQSPEFRDLTVDFAFSSTDSQGLPNVYFDLTFVEFLKDNYSRIQRSVRRDPSAFEPVPVVKGGEVNGDLSKQLEALRIQLQEKDKEVERARESLRGEHQSKQDELVKNIHDLRAQLEVAKAEAANSQEEVTAARKKLQQEVESTAGKADEALKQKEAQWTEEREKLRKQLDDLRNELQEALKENRQTASQLQQSLDDLDQINDMTSKKMQAKDEALESVQKQVNELKAKEAELKKVQEERDDLHKKLSDIKSSAGANDKEVKRLEKEKDDLQKQLDRVQSSVSSKDADLEKAKQEKAEMQKKLDESKKASDKASTEMADLQKKLKEAQGSSEALDTLKKKYADSLKQVMEAKDWEDKVKAAEEKAANIQSEMDDLLLVLGELEDKRAKDKERLKALGEEVSEAEDDEEEDDDEE